jgi:predicted metal-dependent HD superfamily phosphohydrolase
MTLEETFKSTARNYSGHLLQIDQLWKELVTLYSEKSRHYHTLQHLNNIFADIGIIHNRLDDPDAIMFAAFYHDAIYNVLQNDNEERSADLAAKRMTSLSVPDEKITLVIHHIMATKAHALNENSDSNFLTDADLAVLGNEPGTYRTYCEHIRREYSIYPDDIYLAGRKKVLNHFLQMSSIYKTTQFRVKYEQQARLNISQELTNSIY